ncbi:MAG: PHP-associated domain-containing protein [Anaerolineae bacterium]
MGTAELAMGKADLHIHSTAGDGLASVAEILEHVETETELDLIAITDHDLLEGSLEAADRTRERDYRFQVISGMEVTTRGGHLLAYDIQEKIPMLQSLADTIAAVHRQGGFCIIPHPMSWLIWSIGRRRIRAVLRDPREEISFDGIEILNPTSAGWVVHQSVREANAREFHLSEVAGSDAHLLSQIGRGYTAFPGSSTGDFRAALAARTTEAHGEFLSVSEQAVSLSAAGRQLFRGLVLLPGKHLRRAARGLMQDRG